MRLPDDPLGRGKDICNVVYSGISTVQPSQYTPVKEEQKNNTTRIEHTNLKTITKTNLVLRPSDPTSIFPRARNLSHPKPTKQVRFATCLESIRHFNWQDPSVSAQSEPESPAVVQPTYRIVQPVNFCSSDRTQKKLPVQLRKIYLASNGTEIRGIVDVANLAFEKAVAVRFTTDHWQTVLERLAEYHSPSDHILNYDEFRFTTDINFTEAKTLFLCVRYSVKGEEFWDSNKGLNYQITVSPLIQEKERHPPQTTCTAFSHSLSQAMRSDYGTVGRTELVPRQHTRLIDEAAGTRNRTPRRYLGNRYSWEQSFRLISNWKSPDVLTKPGLPCQNTCFSKSLNDGLDKIPIFGQ